MKRAHLIVLTMMTALGVLAFAQAPLPLSKTEIKRLRDKLHQKQYEREHMQEIARCFEFEAVSRGAFAAGASRLASLKIDYQFDRLRLWWECKPVNQPDVAVIHFPLSYKGVQELTLPPGEWKITIWCRRHRNAEPEVLPTFSTTLRRATSYKLNLDEKVEQTLKERYLD